MPRSTRTEPNSFSTFFISRKAMSAPCPGAGIVALDELVDEAGLRDGNQYKEDCHDGHGGKIEGIGSDDARLVEGVDDANHLHECRILLQADEIIEQGRH